MINYKGNRFKSMLYSLATCTVLLSACTMHDEHDEQQSPLNIDYKAAYVINGQDNSISVIKLDNNQVMENIKLHEAVAPHHIALSPDKKQLAIAITATDLSGGHGGHGGSNKGYKVMIMDAITGLPIQSLSTTDMPHNAMYNTAGTELWVGQANSSNGKVLVYDTNNWSVKHTIPVGKSPSEVTFSTDGRYAFIANTADATVTVINQATKALVKTIEVGTEPVGAWPAVNGKMYVDNEAGQSVSVIDVKTLTVEETLALGFKPGYVAYHSGTDELWVSNATKGSVVIYARAGNSWQQKKEIVTGTDAHAILFNEDLTTAYVTNQGSHTVSVINTANYTKIKDIPVGNMPNGIVIR